MNWAAIVLGSPFVVLILWPFWHGASVLRRRWRRRP